MTKFTIFFRLVWLITLLSFTFIDRNNKILVFLMIFLLLILTIITIIRILISRNEWRKMIEDGDVEIKNKISFD